MVTRSRSNCEVRDSTSKNIKKRSLNVKIKVKSVCIILSYSMSFPYAALDGIMWLRFFPYLSLLAKLLELLSLLGALAELQWPTLLSKRDIFR